MRVSLYFQVLPFFFLFFVYLIILLDMVILNQAIKVMFAILPFHYYFIFFSVYFVECTDNYI
jgi:hypothetical protein